MADEPANHDVEDGDEWIEFARYSSPMPGTIVKSKLEAHDVPVMVRGSQLAFGGLGHPAMSDFRLCVQRKDLERARSLLAEDDGGLAESAYRGPQPSPKEPDRFVPTELETSKLRGTVIKLAVIAVILLAMAYLRGSG